MHFFPKNVPLVYIICSRLNMCFVCFYSDLGMAGAAKNNLKSGTRAEPKTKKQNIMISPMGGFFFSSSSGGTNLPNGTFPLLSIFLSNALERLRSLRGAGCFDKVQDKSQSNESNHFHFDSQIRIAKILKSCLNAPY